MEEKDKRLLLPLETSHERASSSTPLRPIRVRCCSTPVGAEAFTFGDQHCSRFTLQEAHFLALLTSLDRDPLPPSPRTAVVPLLARQVLLQLYMRCICSSMSLRIASMLVCKP